MYKLRPREDGAVGLLLSHIGLLIATMILLTVVLGVAFFSGWQQQAELDNVAINIDRLTTDVSTAFYEVNDSYTFPKLSLTYQCGLSTEYVMVHGTDHWGRRLSSVKSLVRVWPMDSFLESYNISSTDPLNNQSMDPHAVHEFIDDSYGSQGTQNEPLSENQMQDILSHYTSSITLSSIHPMTFYPTETITAGKLILYYLTTSDETKQIWEIVIIY